MEDKLKLIQQALGKSRIKLNEKLTYHTFSKSDGVAEGFYIATTVRELIEVLDLCNELKISYFIVGAGTKIITSATIKGMVIKNRTSAIKLAGIKGKVASGGIGIEEAYVEADSGVSLNKLNEFVKKQKLQEITGFSSLHSTVGGSMMLDPLLRRATQGLKIYSDGEVEEIKLDQLKKDMVVLSVIFKFRAA